MPTKPLSWNEMRSRAVRFSAEWAHATSEQSDKHTFWNEFFAVFGVNRKRVGSFEFRAKRTSTGQIGWIDLLWPGVIAVEHKSAGKSLDHADGQNLDYLDDLDENDLPQLLVSCDFQRFRVTDLDTRAVVEFRLSELADNLKVFGPVAGYRKRDFKGQEGASVKAAELLAKVYTELEDNGYTGHDLPLLAVRLLFVLFADDTGVFEANLLEDLIEFRTSEDGSDLGRLLVELFGVLDTHEDNRQTNLDEDLNRFPYINGGLFKDPIRTPVFNAKGRRELLDAIRFDWSSVSPAIFGSIFQSVKDTDARRSLGSHYTTEANILRVIGPLFLDDLKAELQAAHNSSAKLRALQDKMAGLTFLDPAAGCGNFLIVTYRELRRLELDILLRLRDLAQTADKRSIGEGQLSFDARAESKLHVGQFYAIEVDDFPAQIAQTAMYLVDHLENMRLSTALGDYYARFPIQDEAHVTVGNACRLDWNETIPASELDFILGNPPFIGRQHRSAEQVEDMRLAHADADGHGPLDYVTAWYAKAADYIRANPRIRVAFVSTNSITQGENVGLLWPRLLANGIDIDFAVRAFVWGNEARNQAAVHCVIVGFSTAGAPAHAKAIYEEEADPASGAITLVRHPARNISPYLADAPTVIVAKRKAPLVTAPIVRFGNMPNDGGHLIVTAERKDEIDATDPIAAKYIRPLIGADDMLNGRRRYCLWLPLADPSDITNSPVLTEAITATRTYREASTRAATRKLAATPSLFAEIRQPGTDYLCLPRHSSENRRLIPMAFYGPDDIAHDSTLTVEGADEYLFGVLASSMFMAWVRAVGGRIKSDYRLAAETLYNTFPFPTDPSSTDRQRVHDAAAQVLAERAKFPAATLATLYNPTSTPPALTKAHDQLDAAVERLYGRRKFTTDADRQAVLFERYATLTADLLSAPVKRVR